MNPPSLLQRIGRGETSAFRECVDRYGSLVWSLARRAEPNSAEDAVQEIFVDIWKSCRNYDPARAAESTFIAMIARRRIIDRRRKASRQPQAVELTEQVREIPAAASSVEDRFAVGEDAQIARAALNELRQEEREVLEGLLLEGKTYAEVAENLGLPLGTVKTHARRGLIRVRERLAVAGARTNMSGRASS